MFLAEYLPYTYGLAIATATGRFRAFKIDRRGWEPYDLPAVPMALRRLLKGMASPAGAFGDAGALDPLSFPTIGHLKPKRLQNFPKHLL